MNDEEDEPDEEEAEQEETQTTQNNTNKTIEQPIKEPQKAVDPVFCKHCQKNVFPLFKNGRWKCPDCNLYVPIPKSAKAQSKSEIKEAGVREDYKMSSQRPISLSGKEMATSEILINAGLAKNFNDLVRKGIDLMYRSTSLPFNQQLNLNQEQTMEETNPNPKRTMKQLQEQKMMERYIENMGKESSGSSDPKKTMRELQEQKMLEAYINNMSKGNQIEPIQFMMMMRYMDNKGEGKDNKNNGFMDKLLEVQMMKSVMGGQQDNSLTREITDLKHQMATQQLLQQNQQGKTPLQDQLMAMEKVRADRDEQINAAKIDAQKQRDETLKMAMDTKLKEMEKAVEEAKSSSGGLGVKRVQELKEEITAIKEMSSALGDREKSTGEYFADTVSNVAGQLQPAFTNYLQNKQQQAVQQQAMQVPAPADEAVQEPIQPSEPLSNPSNPDKMTPSEQDMSNQMAEMYIEKPPSNEETKS